MDGSIWEISGEVRRVARPLFFVCFFEPFFIAPGAVLGWFWEAKTLPKIDFLGVLFRIRFLIDFLVIFYRFWECFFNVFDVFLYMSFVTLLSIFCSVRFLKILISYAFLQCLVDVGFLWQRFVQDGSLPIFC